MTYWQAVAMFWMAACLANVPYYFVTGRPELLSQPLTWLIAAVISAPAAMGWVWLRRSRWRHLQWLTLLAWLPWGGDND